MQFILMHKMNDELEKGLPPRPEEMAAIGAMMGEAVKKGLMRGGEGLKPTAQRLHLAYVDGKRTMKTPPFEGRGELVAAYALFVVRSKEEALACCDRYAAAAGDVELFLGPVVENWDLGFAPKPDDAPLRFLITRLADARSESDAPMDPKLDAVLAKMTTEGTLQTSGRLKSSKRGTRIRARGGKSTVLDGPFAESKELIGGFAIFELPSMEEAVIWGKRFAETIAVDEVEIREMAD